MTISAGRKKERGERLHIRGTEDTRRRKVGERKTVTATKGAEQFQPLEPFKPLTV